MFKEGSAQEIIVRGVNLQKPDEISCFHVGWKVLINRHDGQWVWATIIGFREDRFNLGTYLGKQEVNPRHIVVKVKTDEGEYFEVAPCDIDPESHIPADQWRR